MAAYAASEPFAVHQVGLAALHNYAAPQHAAANERLRQVAGTGRMTPAYCKRPVAFGQEPAGPDPHLPLTPSCLYVRCGARKQTPVERREQVTWVQRLKRVSNVDIETCPACGAPVRIIACIEDPEVIEKILTHLDAKGAAPEATRRPPCRAPPQAGLFH